MYVAYVGVWTDTSHCAVVHGMGMGGAPCGVPACMLWVFVAYDGGWGDGWGLSEDMD